MIETLRHARDNIYQAPDILARGPGNVAKKSLSWVLLMYVGGA